MADQPKNYVQIPFDINEAAAFIGLQTFGAAAVAALHENDGVLPPNFPACCEYHVEIYNNACRAYNRLTPKGYQNLFERLKKLLKAGFPEGNVIEV